MSRFTIHVLTLDSAFNFNLKTRVSYLFKYDMHYIDYFDIRSCRTKPSTPLLPAILGDPFSLLSLHQMQWPTQTLASALGRPVSRANHERENARAISHVLLVLGPV